LVTLKDIARETGLTVTTVSRVLNSRGYISLQTRDKVYSAMDKLNYQPNEVARFLSKKKTNLIGVIVPQISHPYFAQVICYLENYAYLNDKKILLFSFAKKGISLEECLKKCFASRVSGIILCSGNLLVENSDLYDTPVISIDCDTPNVTTTVLSDNLLAGKLAAEHLASCGCHNLLHINIIGENIRFSDARAYSFQKECERTNVSCKEIQIDAFCDDEIDDDVIEKIIVGNPQIDGIFTSSDILAAKILQVCHICQIEVPTRLKVVGYGDINISKLAIPQITTIHQPIEEMVRIAVELLVSANAGYVTPNKTVLPVSLIKRGTT